MHVDKMRAAFIIRFVLFVDWPRTAFESDSSPYIIGAAGSQRVFRELSRLAGVTSVESRSVEIIEVDVSSSFPRVHVLYIGEEVDANHESKLLEGLGSEPVLTVVNGDYTSQRGGVIYLQVKGARLGFEIDLGAGKKGGLRVSSKLLRLASRVIE